MPAGPVAGGGATPAEPARERDAGGPHRPGGPPRPRRGDETAGTVRERRHAVAPRHRPTPRRRRGGMPREPAGRATRRVATGEPAVEAIAGGVRQRHQCAAPPPRGGEHAAGGRLGGGPPSRRRGQGAGGRHELGALGSALARRRPRLGAGGPYSRRRARRVGSTGAAVRCQATHQAQAPGPLGGWDRAGGCRPTPRPVRGDRRGPVPLAARDTWRSQPAGLGPRAPHRVTPGEVVIQGVAAGAPASPPGQGRARARQAPGSTVASMRVVSRARGRHRAPISTSAAPVGSRGVASAWRRRGAPRRAGWSPARARARHTIVPTAGPLTQPRRGARLRTKTGRVAPGGRP